MTTLCIYHGNCADGFGAAWAVRERFRRNEEPVEFHAGIYQDPPPDVTGKHVVLVDFSYKYDVLCEMSFKARSTLIIDHHESAAEDLARLPEVKEELGHNGFFGDCGDWCRNMNMPLIGALFDMERSGAGLTWDFFFPNEKRPPLIDHIEDRDLWRFKIDGTREIQANVFSYPYDFGVWDRLIDMDVAELRTEGAAIERKHFKDIREFIEAAGHRLTIAGHDVPALNAPYFWSSDAGHLMAQGEPFAACYWNTAEGRVFSLRSAEDGLNVFEIAKQYGGGGHRHAAGFRVPYDHELARTP